MSETIITSFFNMHHGKHAPFFSRKKARMKEKLPPIRALIPVLRKSKITASFFCAHSGCG